MYLENFREPYKEQAVGSMWDVRDLIGRSEASAPIQPAAKTWLQKRGDEKFLGPHGKEMK
jgi:hypothetical protein